MLVLQQSKVIVTILVLVASSRPVLSRNPQHDTDEGDNIENRSEDDDSTTCQNCKTDLQKALTVISQLQDELRRTNEEMNKKYHEITSGTKIFHNKTSDLYYATTCEGKMAKISCHDQNKIKIVSADYGRKDYETCVHDQMETINCSTKNATELVSKKCLSTNSCSIHATNDVFGDPCVNTYKYLTITYFCTNHDEVLKTQE